MMYCAFASLLGCSDNAGMLECGYTSHPLVVDVSDYGRHTCVGSSVARVGDANIGATGFVWLPTEP